MAKYPFAFLASSGDSENNVRRRLQAGGTLTYCLTPERYSRDDRKKIGPWSYPGDK
jgi:hypothetical protein